MLTDDQIEALTHAAIRHSGKLLPIADNDSVSLLPESLRDPREVLRRGRRLLMEREFDFQSRSWSGSLVVSCLTRFNRGAWCGSWSWVESQLVSYSWFRSNFRSSWL